MALPIYISTSNPFYQGYPLFLAKVLEPPPPPPPYPKSLNFWNVLPPLTPLAYPSSFKFCLPPPHFPVTLNPQTHCCAVSLAEWVGWSCHIWCATLLNGSTHIEPWYFSTRKTLKDVLCNKASSDILIWYHTYTNTHSLLRGQYIDTPI